MKIFNEDQYNLINAYLPKQRGNVKISNVERMNAVLSIAENGCKSEKLGILTHDLICASNGFGAYVYRFKGAKMDQNFNQMPWIRQHERHSPSR